MKTTALHKATSQGDIAIYLKGSLIKLTGN